MNKGFRSLTSSFQLFRPFTVSLSLFHSPSTLNRTSYIFPAIFHTKMSSTAINTSMEPAAKRARSSKVIGTHSGSFHADEALAVFLLRQTNEYRDAELIRTRDGKTLDELDIVVDVGGIYDAVKQRYDHHQRGFEEVFGNGDPEVKSPPTSDPSSSVPTPWFTTKLSSAGLVYKHFGREVISNVTGLPQSDKRVQILWIKLYKEFIEAIDGIDNGVEQYGAGAKALYSSRTNLSARVGWLNPRWNEPSNDSLLDEKFKEASKLAGSEFMDRLDYYFKAWLPARDVVEKALLERESIDPSGQIVAFSQSAPWKEHIFELEQTMSIPKPIVYVLYPEDSENPAGKWRIQCVPKDGETFENRKSMPEAWRGVRDEALSTLTGIPGCIFCHASGFIGGNATKEGALAMARAALLQ